MPIRKPPPKIEPVIPQKAAKTKKSVFEDDDDEEENKFGLKSLPKVPGAKPKAQNVLPPVPGMKPPPVQPSQV